MAIEQAWKTVKRGCRVMIWLHFQGTRDLVRVSQSKVSLIRLKLSHGSLSPLENEIVGTSWNTHLA